MYLSEKSAYSKTCPFPICTSPKSPICRVVSQIQKRGPFRLRKVLRGVNTLIRDKNKRREGSTAAAFIPEHKVKFTIVCVRMCVRLHLQHLSKARSSSGARRRRERGRRERGRRRGEPGVRGANLEHPPSRRQRAGLHDKASHPFRYSHMSREAARPPSFSPPLSLHNVFFFARACVCVPRAARRRGRARRIRNPIVLENTKSLSIQRVRERTRVVSTDQYSIFEISPAPASAPAPVRALSFCRFYILCASQGN